MIEPPPPPPPKGHKQLKTEGKRKSFDTNVLDPDYATRAKQWQQTGVIPNLNKGNVPASYQNPITTDMNSTSSRKVKNGLPEYILAALPYLPFCIGFIASLLELFVIPRNEVKVRLHAAQGLAAHLLVFVAITLLNMANSPGLASLCNSIFIITMIVLSIKAFQKKPVLIKFLNPLTGWIDKKVNPRK